MTNRRNLFKFSIALLIFNLILGGFAIFTGFQSKIETAKASDIITSEKKVLGASSAPKFNPNLIISNETFVSTRSFPNEQSVQNHLNNINSPLKNYVVQGRNASYWIFGAARGETSSKWGVVPNINPGVLLALIDKEQSLLSLPNYDVYGDPEKRIKYATGYGCPDTSKCDDQYNGFVNQINWAAYQLQFNYNFASTGQNVAPYKVNNTITTLDEYNIFITNEATAAVYRYTPHVYWGNYNLWKIIVANGWGVAENTYSYADIDAENLATKDDQLDLAGGLKINYSQVENLINKEFNLGDYSEDIKLLQKYLRQEGFYMTRDITGTYGVITDKALKGLRATKGIFGEFKNIDKNRCIDLIGKNYNIGDENQEVKDLQQCLKDMGLFDWPTITGYFGSVTQKGQVNAKKGLSAQQPKAATPVAPQNNSCENLKTQSFVYGETSSRVEQLQNCMQQAGLFKWKFGATGYFGSVTQEAYTKWKGTSSSKNSSCSELKKQSWSVGETSSRVEQLQNCMQQAGLFKWKFGATGYFGDYTKESIIKWRGYL